MYTLSFQVVPGDSWGIAILDNDTAPDTVSANQYTVILYSKYHTVPKFCQHTGLACQYTAMQESTENPACLVALESEIPFNAWAIKQHQNRKIGIQQKLYLS